MKDAPDASAESPAHGINGLQVNLVSNIGMQTFVAKCAVGIHEERGRATVGSVTFKYCWDSNAGSKPANNGCASSITQFLCRTCFAGILETGDCTNGSHTATSGISSTPTCKTAPVFPTQQVGGVCLREDFVSKAGSSPTTGLMHNSSSDAT